MCLPSNYGLQPLVGKGGGVVTKLLNCQEFKIHSCIHIGTAGELSCSRHILLKINVLPLIPLHQ
jgi:hypothetical protein